MSLSIGKAALIATLTSIFSDNDIDSTPAGKAEQMADAIDAYVRTATIQIDIGGLSIPATPFTNVTPVPSSIS